MAPLTRNSFDAQAIASLRRRQGTLLVTGILVAATGITFFCNIVVSSGVSWPMIGLMLWVTGALQLHVSCQIARPASALAGYPVFVFYALFGIVASTTPSPQFAALSLVFFAGVIGLGAIRSYCGYALQAVRGWSWLVAAGMTTLAIGSFLMARWPFNDLSLTGILVALDLAAYGTGLIGFSLHLGRTPSGHKVGDR